MKKRSRLATSAGAKPIGVNSDSDLDSDSDSDSASNLAQILHQNPHETSPLGRGRMLPGNHDRNGRSEAAPIDSAGERWGERKSEQSPESLLTPALTLALTVDQVSGA